MAKVSDVRYSTQSLRLPMPLKQKLSERSSKTAMSENMIVRLALERYLRTK